MSARAASPLAADASHAHLCSLATASGQAPHDWLAYHQVGADGTDLADGSGESLDKEGDVESGEPSSGGVSIDGGDLGTPPRRAVHQPNRNRPQGRGGGASPTSRGDRPPFARQSDRVGHWAEVMLGHPHVHVESERATELLSQVAAQTAAIHTADDLAHQMAEGQGVLAHALARRPVGFGRRQRRHRAVPVQQRRARSRRRQRGETGTVRQQVPDPKVPTCPGDELRPYANDWVVKADAASLDELQQARPDDGLHRRPGVQKGVLPEIRPQASTTGRSSTKAATATPPTPCASTTRAKASCTGSEPGLISPFDDGCECAIRGKDSADGNGSPPTCRLATKCAAQGPRWEPPVAPPNGVVTF